MKRNIVVLAVILTAGCLLGCVGEGNRIITIEAFGNKFVFKDEVPNDHNGEQKFKRDFTPFAQDWINRNTKAKESEDDGTIDKSEGEALPNP